MYATVVGMVELRCKNCKRVFQYEGRAKFFTHCPQCNETVWIAGPRNYGRNNPKVRKTLFRSAGA